MPVPTTFADLSTTIGSNSPAGSDNVFPSLDDYLRALAGFIASISANSGNGWTSPYLTAANPSYTGTLTGGTGVVNLGSGQFYKDASGNVGIGTSSPGAKLDVRAGSTTARIHTLSAPTDLPASGDTVALMLGQYDVGTTGGSMSMTIAASARASLLLTSNYTTGAITDSGAVNFSSKLAGIFAKIASLQLTGDATSGADLAFYTKPTSGTIAERMRIDSSGNVSIGGTPGALARLGVTVADGTYQMALVGTSKALRFQSQTNNYTVAAVDQTLSASYQPLKLGGSTVALQYGTTDGLLLDASGNVGIGTSSPTVPCDVNGAIRTRSTTVASLPAAATAGAGARHFVTDAAATTFASVVAGGGANGVPVYSDGTNWRIG